MKEALPKLKLETLKASPSATSSQESAGGLSPCNLRESATECHSGPAAHLASPSALPESNSDSSTSDTSRLPSCASSRSADLQSFLASRLQQQLQSIGSTIYSLSWKQKATPAGRQYCQRQASVPRTNEIDFSLVPWGTPTVQNSRHGSHSESEMKRDPNNLHNQVYLASWPTPTTRDHKDGAECQNVELNSLLGRVVWQAGWPTPEANANDRTGCPERAMDAYWPDGKKHQQRTQDFAAIAGPTRITASGQMLTGSDAAMESSGQLNPAHSRWLMGFPPEWDVCGGMVTPLCRKLQPNSSQRSWVPLAMRLKAKK